MTCDDCRARLTAYLDGELADDRGSAVRGHLRGCAECRAIAHDEAVLRDGLRELPPIDPPASLWANVQARLAAEEMADAERPAWRRALARWGQLASPAMRWSGIAAAAALCAFVAWRLGRAPASEEASDDRRRDPIAVPSSPQAPNTVASCSPLVPPVVHAAAMPAVVAGDVTAELAADRTRVAESYASAVAELVALADTAQPRWSEDDRHAFCARYGELSRAVADAGDETVRARAYRTLVRYLQRAVVRDEVMLAARAP